MTLPYRRRKPPAAELAKPLPDPFALPHWTDAARAPGPWLMMLEARAPWEYAAMVAAAPWLNKLPVGDGHPVIVFPGLGAADFSTVALRNFLRDRGYTAYPWKQGFNFGPRHGVLDTARAQLQQLAKRHHEKVSLIGWSLGGVYARELAKEQPDHVRCVITLGTPISGHPRATNAWRLYEMVSGQSVHDPELLAQLRSAPLCPTTSIYSKTDGVVAWQCSINDPAPLAENIEVHASHVGMGMNPLALYAVADRLAQDPAQWQRFDLRGARRWLYKVTHPLTTPRAAA
ncbi:MAG: alpha/beta hydrolase [Rubrivivax sp.]|nr:alpha/beta hydrolase [Rubrivivax sp.]